MNGFNNVALGFDETTLLSQVRKGISVTLKDPPGKVTLAKHIEMSTINVKTIPESNHNFERLFLSAKELGLCELYLQTLAHKQNGFFVAVFGDRQHILYTIQ